MKKYYACTKPLLESAANSEIYLALKPNCNAFGCDKRRRKAVDCFGVELCLRQGC